MFSGAAGDEADVREGVGCVAHDFDRLVEVRYSLSPSFLIEFKKRDARAMGYMEIQKKKKKKKKKRRKKGGQIER